MGTVRSTVRSGAGRMATSFPSGDRETGTMEARPSPDPDTDGDTSSDGSEEPENRPAESPHEPQQAEDPDDGPEAASSGGSAAASTRRQGTYRGRSRLSPRVSDGSGVVLGLLVWGWLIVPYLKGGTQGVKDVLGAKFLNKKGGKPLP